MRLPLTVLVFLSTVVALRAEESAAPPDSGLSLWGLIQQGGWAMWPLGLCSLATLVLVIHASRETRRARFIPDAVLPQLSQSLANRELPRAIDLIAADQTVLSRILSNALPRARSTTSEADIRNVEESVAEGIEHEETVIGQWVNYLNVVATVSPMIGLLGTVSGMIGAFQTIASGGMGRPELLAGDIGEALITTATGLVIGIPAMIAYFVMRNRLGNQVMATAQTATRLIDTLAAGSDDSAP
jgi:biopolymer transport protein ExbB